MTVLGRVGVDEGGGQHGQCVREDDHAEYDGDDDDQEAETVVAADVAVTGRRHRHHGEIHRYRVVLIDRYIRGVFGPFVFRGFIHPASLVTSISSPASSSVRLRPMKEGKWEKGNERREMGRGRLYPGP